ncbi:MAG: exodeoxyribonuclease VII large subunit [Actinomycetota bacterium]
MSDQTLTVSELGIVVRAALEQAMPYGVWVEGEIQGISRSRNGHVYFDLVEPAETAGAAPVATVPVVLFRDVRERVNRLLKRHGDPIRMTDGVRIRIQGMVDFYPPTGKVQLRMSAIDPTYTLGVLAAEREALLRVLSESGRLRANAGWPVPAVPLRIGVVTSIGSAAHADVTTVFERSERAFTLVEIDTAVQGTGAERTIAAAIGAAEQASVDLVLVVRGGGSKTDLAVFDHALVADAIAGAEIPVFTGIGHDIDRSIADEVAHTAHTTPTAAAQAIVEVVDTWLDRLAANEREVVHRSRRAIERADERVARVRRDAARSASVAVDRADDRLVHASNRLRRSAVRAETTALGALDRAVDRLNLAARHGLRAAELRLDTADVRTRALDPAIALARGWSITRRRDGTIVRSADEVDAGDTVTTQVADGTFTSTIDDRE